MPLSPQRVVEQARILKGYHEAERAPLEMSRRYLKGIQRLPAVIPATAPRELRVMAQSSRVNMIRRVVESLVQSTRVEGFRSGNDADDLDIWAAWQANGMDARQEGLHRAAYTYGTSYAIVLPGDSYPVIRGVSPRDLTAVYGEDPDWPLWALERLGKGLWRLYDSEATYYIGEDRHEDFTYIDTREHGLKVTPVVRYVDENDLDAEDEVSPDTGLRAATAAEMPTRGQVAPLMALQDQVDLTTFGMQIAQHYGAFRQRWIIGWTADSEEELLKASASQVWTFDGEAEGENAIKIGEFAQTQLDGYIRSREASVRHMAVISQTPLHELTPDQANPVSAEALAALEAGRDRKLDSHELLLGEAHEQTFRLAGRLMGVEVPDDAQVRWADTSARAFAATVDALGKMGQMLGVPQEALWERIPGVTRQDIEQWRSLAGEGDAFSDLTELLSRQANANGNGSQPEVLAT